MKNKDEEAISANTKELKQQFLTLCELVYDIQTKTEYCPFMSFFGHVNNIDINIAKTKDDYDIHIFGRTTKYLNKNYQDMISELKELYNDDSKRYN